MKKIIVTFFVVFSLVSLRSSAQVSINVNIGSQPLWGPVGYDYVDYYYLPEIESYYYVPERQFVYLSNGRWIFSASLPSRYRGYDLYRGYKVVVNGRNAYLNINNDRIRYAKYKKVHNQRAIRYSNDPRYYVIKGHPHGMPPGQAKKVYSNGNNNNKGNGRGRGAANGKGKR
ncbi:hypothetical protein [Albibacterium bauzanense]|uniref:Uncharacterized protein n=1 Tax=Albibacterium bauzanense TaxID=653929 RepID=A0A4R1M6V3_9SPHI|nr:hypothetical protein [Albibacterium bauzanense]TCK85519.1 hypothetical protein C8N28_0828 [Albibacterium bauzanense]